MKSAHDPLPQRLLEPGPRNGAKKYNFGIIDKKRI